MKAVHTIFWDDGTDEPCFCTYGVDHNENEGNWQLIDDEDDDGEDDG